jgi:hypothetical protein
MTSTLPNQGLPVEEDLEVPLTSSESPEPVSEAVDRVMRSTAEPEAPISTPSAPVREQPEASPSTEDDTTWLDEMTFDLG